jgi:hypothetical protein
LQYKIKQEVRIMSMKDKLEALRALRATLPQPKAKAGMGAKKVDAKAPAKVAPKAKEISKGKAKPAPKAKEVVKKTNITNLRPGEPTNFEKLATQLDAKDARAIQKLVSPGWLLVCPDGTVHAFAHDNGEGSAALVYRAPIRNIFPKIHRGE